MVVGATGAVVVGATGAVVVPAGGATVGPTGVVVTTGGVVGKVVVTTGLGAEPSETVSWTTVPSGTLLGFGFWKVTVLAGCVAEGSWCSTAR